VGGVVRLLILSIFMVIAADGQAGDYVNYIHKGGVVVDRVVKVVDGDTIYVDIYAWPDLFGKEAKIRLRGVDTPEMRGKCPAEKVLAREAKAFVEGALGRAKLVVIANLSRGSFFRVVADVYLDGESLGKMLLDLGLGRVYTGVWC